MVSAPSDLPLWVAWAMSLSERVLSGSARGLVGEA